MGYSKHIIGGRKETNPAIQILGGIQDEFVNRYIKTGAAALLSQNPSETESPSSYDLNNNQNQFTPETIKANREAATRNYLDAKNRKNPPASPDELAELRNIMNSW